MFQTSREVCHKWSAGAALRPAKRHCVTLRPVIAPQRQSKHTWHLSARQKRGPRSSDTVLEPDGDDEPGDLALEGDDLGEDPPGHRSGK